MSGAKNPNAEGRTRWAWLSLLALVEAGTGLMLLAQWGAATFTCGDHWWMLLDGEVSVSMAKLWTPWGVTCRATALDAAAGVGIVRVVLWPTLVSLCIVALALVATVFLLYRELRARRVIEKE